MPRGIKFRVVTLVLIICTCGCAGLKTEFFRGETRYLYNRGCQHYRQGDYSAARQAFERVLLLDPAYGPAFGALGTIAFVEGDHEAGIAHFRSAVQADSGLENSLRPLIQAATVQAARKPIIEAGVDLSRIYQLASANDQAGLEAVLAKEVTLELLARDTLSLTLTELEALGSKMAASADPEKGTVRYRLFSAYLLFYLRKDPDLSAALIEKAVPQAEIEERKTAYVILGRLRERSGDFNLAVDAYLMALRSGVPDAEIAPHLARIYNLEETSLNLRVENNGRQTLPAPPIQLELSMPGPGMPSVPFGAAGETGDLKIQTGDYR